MRSKFILKYPDLKFVDYSQIFKDFETDNGEKILVAENKILYTDKKVWRCSKRTSLECRCRIHTGKVNGEISVIKRYFEHNHLPKSTAAAVNQVCIINDHYYAQGSSRLWSF